MTAEERKIFFEMQCAVAALYVAHKTKATPPDWALQWGRMTLKTLQHIDIWKKLKAAMGDESKQAASSVSEPS